MSTKPISSTSADTSKGPEQSPCSPSLVNRLRGIYTLQVDPAIGPLNGSDTFTRKFEGLPPINEEAAKRIERLESALQAIIKHQEMTAGNLAGYSATRLIAERALNG